MANIIVIEDERELAHVIRRTLQDDGHSVDVYADGRLALDRLVASTRENRI